MKIAVYSLTYWYTEAEAKSKKKELEAWERSIRRSINPDYMWLVSGTYSDPAFNPVPHVPLINTGIKKTHGNDFLYWSYANLAHTLGIYNALLNTDCDLCAQFSTDSIINIDYKPFLDAFMNRPELVMAPGWCGNIEDAAIFYKREGLLEYTSKRRRPILVEPGTQPPPLMTEQEALEIFKGKWWNPWPEHCNFRQEYRYAQTKPSNLCASWPIVIRPAPDIIERCDALWQKS